MVDRESVKSRENRLEGSADSQSTMTHTSHDACFLSGNQSDLSARVGLFFLTFDKIINKIKPFHPKVFNDKIADIRLNGKWTIEKKNETFGHILVVCYRTQRELIS